MNPTDIANLRLFSHQIAETGWKTVETLVDWMGAMQAQDYAMAKWAIGIRLAGSTEQAIETAFNEGKIIRAHLLRPTWHFVSANDIYWMRELSAPQIKAAIRSRHKELELSEAVYSKSNQVIEVALRDGEYLTRDELTAVLEKTKIVLDASRAYHLLLWAELEGLVCSGPIKDGKQTYALLADRAPQTKPLTREEALATLARKYFASHGPAALQDFTWWSGLSGREASKGLEMMKADLISETVDSHIYWWANSLTIPETRDELFYLLPAFDEFIISYKDRRAALPFENWDKAISNNGVFRPVIVNKGQVSGIWKRTIKKDSVFVELEFFNPPGGTTLGAMDEAVDKFGRFLDKKAILRHT